MFRRKVSKSFPLKEYHKERALERLHFRKKWLSFALFVFGSYLTSIIGAYYNDPKALLIQLGFLVGFFVLLTSLYTKIGVFCFCRKLNIQKKEYIQAGVIIALISASFAYNQEDSLTTESEPKLSYSASTILGLDVLWINLILSFYFYDWRVKFLIPASYWIVCVVQSSRFVGMNIGLFLSYIRVLLSLCGGLWLQERSLRVNFMEKYNIQQNSKNMNNILNQIHENIIILNLASKIKYYNLNELAYFLQEQSQQVAISVDAPLGSASRMQTFENLISATKAIKSPIVDPETNKSEFSETQLDSLSFLSKVKELAVHSEATTKQRYPTLYQSTLR